nr:hypothetical protein GCM10020063_053610 [Dactylosporangium thailandense]
MGGGGLGQGRERTRNGQPDTRGGRAGQHLTTRNGHEGTLLRHSRMQMRECVSGGWTGDERPVNPLLGKANQP